MFPSPTDRAKAHKRKRSLKVFPETPTVMTPVGVPGHEGALHWSGFYAMVTRNVESANAPPHVPALWGPTTPGGA